MTQPFVVTPAPARPAAAPLPRLAALAAGLVLLALGALISFGTALVAPVGMLIAAWVQRARGRALTRWGGWIVAAAAVTVVLLAAGGIAAAAVPADAWRRAEHAADSASQASAKEPPPAWLERIAPGSTQRAAQTPPLPPGLQRAAMVWGALFGAALLGATFGTLGWAGGMLLGFGAAGRWPGAAPAPSADTSSA